MEAPKQAIEAEIEINFKSKILEMVVDLLIVNLLKWQWYGEMRWTIAKQQLYNNSCEQRQLQ